MLGTQVGPYRVVRLLGEGGMGSVYEAVNDNIERRVAIKVLHKEYAGQPEVVTRFFNEARAANRINHPSMVQIHELGSLADGTAYIVMEYLDGQTLARCVQDARGRLELRRALQYSWQIATALAEAHNKGIIHRDLKPANVMLVRDALVPGGERAKILDFGIAKLATDTRHGKTASHIIMGTPSYMSPEQCRGAGTVDDKSDVYSLGVMMFVLISGRLPFEAEGAGEIIGMHLHQAPPQLDLLVPDLPAQVAALVHRLLNKDRQTRPSMQEVARALELMLTTHLSGGSIESPMTQAKATTLLTHLAAPTTTLGLSAGQPELQPSRWRRSFLIAGALASTFLGGASALVSWQGALHSGPQAKQELSGAQQVPLAASLLTTENSKAQQRERLNSTENKTLPATPEPATNQAREQPVTIQDEKLSTAATIEPGGKKRRAVVASKSIPAHSTDKLGETEAKNEPISYKMEDPELTGAPELPAAEEHLANGRWQDAIRTAMNPKLLRSHPHRVWAVIGQASCMLGRTSSALEAYERSDDAGRKRISAQCANKGITLRRDMAAAAPDLKPAGTADSILDANGLLLQRKYPEAIAIARAHTKTSPHEAWRIIGQAACQIKSLKQASEARRMLAAQAQQELDWACESAGIERVGDTYNIRVQ